MKLILGGTVMLLVGLGSVIESQKMPGGYRLPPYLHPVRIPQVRDVQALMPSVEICLRDWAELKPTDRVEVVTDPDVPPLVLQAFQRGLEQHGAAYVVRTLPADRLLEKSDADLLIELAYDPLESSAAQTSHGKRVKVLAVPEILASPWSRFPRPLFHSLVQTAQRYAARGSRIRLADGAGSDLWISDVRPRLSMDPAVLYYPPLEPLRFELTPQSKVEGSVATHSTERGLMPLLRLRFLENVLQEAWGGGAPGEAMRAWLRSGNVVRVESLQLGIQPQAFRYVDGRGKGSLARWGHFAGSQRAGVVTLALTFGNEGVAFRGPRQLQLFFPSVWLEDEPLVGNGYPAFLLDPQLRQLSAILGAPSALQITCAEYLPVVLPKPKAPTLPKVSGAADLERGAQTCLKDWVFLKKGDRLLILTDDSVPSMIPQAFESAAKSMGAGAVDQFSLGAAPAGELSELARQVGSQKLPSEAWRQIEAHDVIVSPAFLFHLDLSREGRSFSEWLAEQRKRFAHVVAVPELLASSWAVYPPALLEELGEGFRLAFQNAKACIVATQDAEVVVNFEGGKRTASLVGLPLKDRFGATVFPPSPRFRINLAPGSSTVGDMVTRRFFAESVEAVSFGLTASRIEALTESFARRFLPLSVDAGSQQLVEISIGLSPHAAPASSEGDAFSPGMWNRFAQLQRSGVAHFVTSHWPASLTSDPWFPWGFELFFPSVNVDGTRVVVELGHVNDLDQPALRARAAKFGDPEQLLTELWIPTPGHAQ